MLAADTGESLRNARVTFAPGGQRVAPVFTDSHGRFWLTNLRADRYTVAAHKPGFANAADTVLQTLSKTIARSKMSKYVRQAGSR